MTGKELRAARVRLGELWGLGRPVFAAELGRALQLCPSDPGQSVRDYEAQDGAKVPGPVCVAVEFMLRGAVPPGGIGAVVMKRRAEIARS
jgi:hypothetical protein